MRRFRPNVLVEIDAPGRPEDAWPGKALRVGEISVRILKPVKCCVMTTLPQPPLAAEKGVLAEVLARSVDGRGAKYFNCSWNDWKSARASWAYSPACSAKSSSSPR